MSVTLLLLVKGASSYVVRTEQFYQNRLQISAAVCTVPHHLMDILDSLLAAIGSGSHPAGAGMKMFFPALDTNLHGGCLFQSHFSHLSGLPFQQMAGLLSIISYLKLMHQLLLVTSLSCQTPFWCWFGRMHLQDVDRCHATASQLN